MDCDTAALCNAVAGMCTAAKCVPGKFVCQGDMLLKCNPDGTDFESPKSCEPGRCDAAGGDCNQCEPGQKTCDQNVALTCKANGQGNDESPCSGTLKCVGAGKCVECDGAKDCVALTKDCKVGACEQNRCVAVDASAGVMCMTSGRPGTCSQGSCVCTPQCTKECGVDGCGRDCPSRCGSAQMCVKDQCVDCTSNAQCEGSADGCSAGVCGSDGTCTLSSTPRNGTDCRTSSNAPGTCSGGKCVCTSDCGAQHCGGTDVCGKACSYNCGSQECSTTSNRCETPAPVVPTPVFCSISSDPSECANMAGKSCGSGGYCISLCAAGDSCAPGFVCVDSIACLIKPPCPGGTMPGTVTINGPTVCVAPDGV